MSNPPNPNSDLSTDFDPLPIPQLDPFIFSSDSYSTAAAAVPDAYISTVGFDLGPDNDDFELTFDGLDDLYLPEENEDFLIPDGFDPATGFLKLPGESPAHPDFASEPSCSKEISADRSSNADVVLSSGSPESRSSQISGDRRPDVARVLNYRSSESGSDNLGCDRNSSVARVLNCPSPESGGPVSSQGSGNFRSGVSDSRNSDRDVSSNVVVDQKIKEEEIGKTSVSKRKKEKEDPNSESRTSKYRKSSTTTTTETSNPQYSLTAADNEEDDKRKARLMRNRESAQLSRQRKKHYVEELEDKLRIMNSTIADLNGKISYFMAENSSLRQQLSGVGGGGGMCQPPPPGMYPHMAPMAYPWVPCAPYVVKPQGSQVPLVPIPRLKPQQPVSASKAKKTENKKSEGRTKKVASISFLGLLFFMLLFGGLVPIVNVKFGGMEDGGYIRDRFYDQRRGRVLTVSGHLNGSDDSTDFRFSNGKFDISNRLHCEKGRAGGTGYDAVHKEQGSQHAPGSDEFVRTGNDSEPLVASLYVPRNDKLVKIDGNLIIHSVLASEKAMASRSAPEIKNTRETSLAMALAIPKGGGNIGRHSHVYRNPAERQKALTSGSADTLKDHSKSTAADGKMQQWFREGLAGPLLSSGMCTEVFQFDVSPSPGVIIPASAVNITTTTEHRQNATSRLKKRRNRRFLGGLPVTLARSNLNISEEQVVKNLQKDNFQGNKSVSSMVVSVLLDPREVGDSDSDGMIAPKSLSRIFVVVLLDSVKYVTYSCMLPLSGPHLVTT